MFTNQSAQKSLIHIVLLSLFLWLVSCQSKDGELITDGSGFSFSYENSLTAQPKNEGFHHLFHQKDGLHVYLLMSEGNSKQQAMDNALSKIGFDINEFSFGGGGAMKQWFLSSFSHQDSKQELLTATQYYDGKIFVIALTAEDKREKIGNPPMDILRLLNTVSFSDESFKLWEPSNISEIEQHVAQKVDSLGGSISIAVIKDGKLIYQHANGESAIGKKADINTVYHLGSISKLMVATSIMQLVENKQLSLDDKASQYIEQLPNSITVKHLLTHSSALPDFEVQHLIATANHNMPSSESALTEYLNKIKGQQINAGMKTNYNNWNFLVLAVLVERITNQSITQYVETNIFNKAGLFGATYNIGEVDEHNQAYALISQPAKDGLKAVFKKQGVNFDDLFAGSTDELIQLNSFDILPAWGGMSSRASDTAQFGWLFLNKGKVNDQSILKKSSVKKMLKMQKNDNKQETGLGLSWFLGEDSVGKYAQHSGGGPGIESLLKIYPKQDLSIAIMGNINGYNPEQIAEALGSLFE